MVYGISFHLNLEISASTLNFREELERTGHITTDRNLKTLQSQINSQRSSFLGQRSSNQLQFDKYIFSTLNSA